MNWYFCTVRLLERIPEPVVVLGEAGTIQAVNHSFETVFNTDRYDVVGRFWHEFAVNPTQAGKLERWQRDALNGTLYLTRQLLRMPGGKAVEATVESELIGHNPATLIVTLHSVAEVGPSISWIDLQYTDIDYEITIVENFGLIRHVDAGTKGLNILDEEYYCYQAFHRRHSPCKDCPVLKAPHFRGEWTSIRDLSNAGKLQVVVARFHSDSTAQITVRNLPRDVIAELLKSEILRICQAKGLTPREQEVFEQLLLGHTTNKIADILRISQRTVKFHQGNIFGKLDISNRAELLRLLLSHS